MHGHAIHLTIDDFRESEHFGPTVTGFVGHMGD